MSEQEWIDKLVVGDEVLISSGHNKGIYKIDKITPARQFKVCSLKFNKFGSQIGGDTWRRFYMGEITDKDKDDIKRRVLLSAIKSFTYENLSTETLERICGLIKE